MPRWTGWRYAALWGGIIGAVGAAMYPIAVDPYLNPEKWQNIQEESRRGINQKDIQPGGMRVWSNPFEAKPEDQPSGKQL